LVGDPGVAEDETFAFVVVFLENEPPDASAPRRLRRGVESALV
jgi:hypothetical protein